MQPRPAGRCFGDWQGLLDLILTSFASMEGRIDPPSSAHQLTCDALRDKAQRDYLWVAGASPLLGCMFLTAQPDALYIGKLAIAPQAQGRGLGRAFVTAAQAQARQLSLPRLRLETRIELVENHAAFAAMGFTQTACKAHPGYDRATSITMEKLLDIPCQQPLSQTATAR